MMHHGDALHGPEHGSFVADIASDELDIPRSCWIFPNIQNLNFFTTSEQTPGNQIAQKPGAASDQVYHTKSLFPEPSTRQGSGACLPRGRQLDDNQARLRPWRSNK